jgi:chemotaxis protein methyltransferase WspC
MTRVAKIDALLEEAMGLDSTSIGSSSIERAVHARMAQLGAATLRDYWQRLVSSADELQELIELVVVPETWFFRDREAFAELARGATTQRRAPSSTPLRLLSLPCSTGEEPYSMAMALQDAGLPPESFRIDAVDISARALAHAARGVYGKNSFRGDDLAFRARHFDETAHGYCLRDPIRRSVRFLQGNVHAADFLSGVEPYDTIFCRNLLIYFDRPTQQRAIAVLDRMLSTTGVLFVGPAETSLFLDQNFVPLRVPLAFALRRAGKTPLEQAPGTQARQSAVVAAKAAPVRGARQTARPSQSARVAARPPTPPTPPAPPVKPLDRASDLADQGRFAEALTLCEAELRNHGPSAQVFYLLGLIYSADGLLAAADRSYRKALYLDKDHHDAMLHLAALLEQQGETREPKMLRQRARRS